jgi:hypothetical protein
MRGRAHLVSKLGRAVMIVALMGATLLATATPSGDSQHMTERTLAASGAPPAPASGAGTAAHPAGQSPPSGVAGLPGFKVQLDEAGRPVVPALPPVAAAAVARRQRPPLIELETPAGGTMLMLDDRFHHHSVAHREADGSLSVDCGRQVTAAAEAQDAGPLRRAPQLPPTAYAPLARPAACAAPTIRVAETLP